MTHKYAGVYPKDQADEKFREWRDKVRAFIDALAARSQPTEDK